MGKDYVAIIELCFNKGKFQVTFVLRLARSQMSCASSWRSFEIYGKIRLLRKEHKSGVYSSALFERPAQE